MDTGSVLTAADDWVRVQTPGLVVRCDGPGRVHGVVTSGPVACESGDRGTRLQTNSPGLPTLPRGECTRHPTCDDPPKHVPEPHTVLVLPSGIPASSPTLEGVRAETLVSKVSGLV